MLNNNTLLKLNQSMMCNANSYIMLGKVPKTFVRNPSVNYTDEYNDMNDAIGSHKRFGGGGIRA